ncbi:MAG: AAA family ATPase [Clostridia bacterium]
MKRSIISSLINWKENENKKPLIIKGVRQCGKTYILKEFGNSYYNDMVYINFEENESLKSIFESDFDTTRILFELGLFVGKTIKPQTTLIVFDEIQECGRAITSLKYFCENSPLYHIICAGSLLGIALNKPLSFPVGKVDFLTMYPMDFTEFVKANNEDMLADYILSFSKGDKVPEVAHTKLSRLLKEYYVTGGMPEVVSTWAETHDFEKMEIVQQRIIDSYELDFAKHAPIKDFPKLTAIWKSIPEQLAKENKKFVFGHVKKGLRAKDLEDALQWLVNAGLVYQVCQIEKPFIPMSAYENSTAFKLYMSDIGLLRKLSKLPYKAILDSSSIYVQFKGAMTENYVLCELIKSVDDKPYYWTSNNKAEVDFIVQCEDEIVPIEVKSETNVKARSLAEYRKKYEPNYSVITSMKSETNGSEILNIPLYLISKLKQIII